MKRISLFSTIFIAMLVVLGNFISVSPAFAQVNHCGTISANETWAGGTVHVVTCTVTVGPNATLTVTEGAIVKFSSSASLSVQGSLRVLGITENPVYIAV